MQRAEFYKLKERPFLWTSKEEKYSVCKCKEIGSVMCGHCLCYWELKCHIRHNFRPSQSLMEDAHMQVRICHKIVWLNYVWKITVKTRSLRDHQVELPRGLHLYWHLQDKQSISHNALKHEAEAGRSVGVWVMRIAFQYFWEF